MRAGASGGDAPRRSRARREVSRRAHCYAGEETTRSERGRRRREARRMSCLRGRRRRDGYVERRLRRSRGASRGFRGRVTRGCVTPGVTSRCAFSPHAPRQLDPSGHVRSRTAIGAACRDWFLKRVFDEASGASRSALLSTPSRRSSHRRHRPRRHPHRHPRLRQSRAPGETAPASPAARTSAGTRFWYRARRLVRGRGTVVPAAAATVGATSSGASVARGPSGRRSASDARRFSGGAMGVRPRYPRRRSAAAVVPSAPPPTAVSASERASTRESPASPSPPPAKNPPRISPSPPSPRPLSISPWRSAHVGSYPAFVGSHPRVVSSSESRERRRRRVVASRARRPTASFPSRTSRRRSHRARRVPRRRRRRPRTRRSARAFVRPRLSRRDERRRRGATRARRDAPRRRRSARVFDRGRRRARPGPNPREGGRGR